MANSAGDAHEIVVYGAHFRATFPIIDNTGSLVTGAAGLDSEFSNDGGTFADCTNEATEIATSSGIYYLDLIGTETDAKQVAVIVKTSTTDAKTSVIILYPERLCVIASGTAQAGASGTITLAAGTSKQNNDLAGLYVFISNNGAAGSQYQVRKIISNVTSTQVATIDSNWGTNPSSSSTYDLLCRMSTNMIAFAGTMPPSIATAGIQDVNVKNINNTAAATPGASGGILISGSNSGTTTLGALTVTGAVSFGSTFGVTGTVTYNAFTVTNALTISGSTTFTGAITGSNASNNLRINGAAPGASGGLLISGSNSGTTTLGALTVSGATTLTGAVSLGSTLGVTGTTTFAAVNTGAIATSGTVTFNAFTVTNATTLTGIVTASNASNNIVGIDVTKLGGSTTPITNMTTVFSTDFATNYNTTNDGWVVKLGNYAQGGAGTQLQLEWLQIDDSLTTGGVCNFDSFAVTNGTTFTGAITGTNASNDLRINGAVPGAAGGLFIAGTNAATTVTTSFTTTFTGNLTGSVASVVGAVGSVTGAVGSVTGNVGGNVTGSVGSVTGDIGGLAAGAITDVAGAVWDAVLASYQNSGSTGEALGNANSAGDPWGTALPGAYGAGTAGNILGNNLDAAITSRMASYTQPTGFLAATFPGTVASTTNITAGTITTVTNLTNAPTSGDFTATMKTSIGTAVAASAVASVTGNVGGNVTGTIGGLAAGAVTDVEDAVWDATLSGHLSAGSTGFALNAAGSAGDPWGTALPGAYGAGTAGNIIGNNLDAAMSTRLAPTTPGRTLDVTTTGAAGIDWGNVENQGTSVNLGSTITYAIVTALNPIDCVFSLPSMVTNGSISVYGEVQSSTSNGVIFDPDVTGPVDADQLVGCVVTIIRDDDAGTLGQPRMITAASYSGSDIVLTVSPDWISPPTADLPDIVAVWVNGPSNLVTIGNQAVTCAAPVTVLASVGTAATSTAQTGDSFARIGATGSGLTSLASSATALSTAVWTAPPTGFLAATFPATVASTTNITAGTITTVSGNVTGSVGSVVGAVGSVTGTVGGIAGTTQTLDALQTALNTAHGAGSWATATGFATSAQGTAIQAKTDQLTFTVAGQLDTNIQYVNDVQVTGVGTAGNPWGPV